MLLFIYKVFWTIFGRGKHVVPVMLERSEASQQQRTCHPDRAQRRGISKTTANMSCWNEVKHLYNTKTIFNNSQIPVDNLLKTV